MFNLRLSEKKKNYRPKFKYKPSMISSLSFLLFYCFSYHKQGTMPPQEPLYSPSSLLERGSSSESLDMMRSDYIQGTNKK